MLDNRKWTVAKAVFVTPDAFNYVAESSIFLTFRVNVVEAWTLEGERVAVYPEHNEWAHAAAATSSVTVTPAAAGAGAWRCAFPHAGAAAAPLGETRAASRDCNPLLRAGSGTIAVAVGPRALITYGRVWVPHRKPCERARARTRAAGGSVAPADGTLVVSDVASGRHIATRGGPPERGGEQAAAALLDVTAVCWNEERSEVVTGTHKGTIAVWS